jgi:hypothetical protein
MKARLPQKEEHLTEKQRDKLIRYMLLRNRQSREKGEPLPYPPRGPEGGPAIPLQTSSVPMEALTPPSSGSSTTSPDDLNEAYWKQNALIDARNKVALKAVEEMQKRPFSQQQYDKYKASIYWTDNKVPPPEETSGVRQAYERKYGKHKSGH